MRLIIDGITRVLDCIIIKLHIKYNTATDSVCKNTLIGVCKNLEPKVINCLTQPSNK